MLLNAFLINLLIVMAIKFDNNIETTRKTIFCDIDGTLTNGLLWYGDKGEELKSFNVKDGLAIRKLLSIGFKIGFLSGRDSLPLRARVRDLGVEFFRFKSYTFS